MEVRPLLPPNFRLFATSLTVERVRFTLIRLPAGDTVLTRTSAFSPDSTSLRLALSVPLAGTQDSLRAVLDYQTAQGVTLLDRKSVV